MSNRHPFVSGRTRVRPRRLGLVLRGRRLLLVLPDLLQVPHLLVVHRGSRPLAPDLAVRHVVRINQRNVFGILIMRVREVLVVVTGIREVGEIADGGVLVDLVTGRLARGRLGGNLVRRRRTRREGPAVDGRTYDCCGGSLGLDGGPAGV